MCHMAIIHKIKLFSGCVCSNIDYSNNFDLFPLQIETTSVDGGYVWLTEALIIQLSSRIPKKYQLDPPNSSSKLLGLKNE